MTSLFFPLGVLFLSTDALALDVEAAGNALPGATLTLTVVGADPGETVHLVRATAPGTGPCPPPLGGLCLDLDPTRAALIAQVTTDATGEGDQPLTLPGTVPVGADLWVQAVAVRGAGGVDSVKSEVVQVTVLDPLDADGDGFDPGVDCDDFDAAVHPGALEICDGRDNDCDGSTSEGGLVSHSGVNYGTISDAVTFAPDGEVVAICPGTYIETVVVDRPMTLLGVGGAAVTIVDGDQAAVPVIDLTLSGAVVEGLTITNGAGGGLEAVGASVVRHSVVTGNSRAGSGGGVYGVDIVLDDVEISYNTASQHGGGLFTGGVQAVDVRFIGNVADTAGGAVYLSGFGLQGDFTECVFHSNEALGIGGATGWDNGGGIFAMDTTDAIEVVDSDFGVGPTENLPTDVWLYDGFSSVGYTTFQDGESFTCDPGVPECL